MDSSTFDSTLSIVRDPSKAYTFYVRKAETETHNPSEPRSVLVKGEQAISDDELATVEGKISVTSSNIFANVPGYEFSTDALTFNSTLNVTRDSAKAYTIYIRKAETDTCNPSESRSVLVKGEQTVSSSELATIENKAVVKVNSITIPAISGFEFYCDNKWSSQFSQSCQRDTTYTISVRKAETSTFNASPAATVKLTTPFEPYTSTIDGKVYYLLETERELKWFANEVNVNKNTKINAKLTADIALNDTSNLSNWATSAPANSWTPISSFAGIFDGDGHTVSGMYINTSSGGQGFFGAVNGGTIKNFGIIDGYVKAGGYSAGLASTTSGTIDNCMNSVTVVVTDWFGGGLVALSSGEIKDSYNKGTISGVGRVGGVVGQAGGMVSGCGNGGDVTTSDWFTGGVAGASTSSFLNCFNTADVTGGGRVGGIVGDFPSSGSIRNCFSHGYASGSDRVGGIVGSIGDGSSLAPVLHNNFGGNSSGNRICGYIESTGTVTINTCTYVVGKGGTTVSNVCGGYSSKAPSVVNCVIQRYGSYAADLLNANVTSSNGYKKWTSSGYTAYFAELDES